MSDSHKQMEQKQLFTIEEIRQVVQNTRNLEAVPPIKGSPTWLNEERKVPNLVWYKGMAFPTLVNIDTIENLQFDSQDIFLCGQMKTGTTWAIEILYHLVTGGKDLLKRDLPLLRERVLTIEDPWCDGPAFMKSPPPRLFRSHMHYAALPESYHAAKPKTIYLLRNPRDTCVSHFKFCRAMTPMQFTGSFDDFFESFLSGNVLMGPFTSSVKSFWENCEKHNILFLSYENLHKEFNKEVHRIADFLGIPLDEQLLGRIHEGTTLQFMRENNSTNYSDLQDAGFLKYSTRGGFMRKGQVGDWKNYFSEEQCRKMDDLMDKELTPLGVKFCYEI